MVTSSKSVVLQNMASNDLEALARVQKLALLHTIPCYGSPLALDEFAF